MFRVRIQGLSYNESNYWNNKCVYFVYTRFNNRVITVGLLELKSLNLWDLISICCLCWVLMLLWEWQLSSYWFLLVVCSPAGAAGMDVLLLLTGVSVLSPGYIGLHESCPCHCEIDWNVCQQLCAVFWTG